MILVNVTYLVNLVVLVNFVINTFVALTYTANNWRICVHLYWYLIYSGDIAEYRIYISWTVFRRMLRECAFYRIYI